MIFGLSLSYRMLVFVVHDWALPIMGLFAWRGYCRFERQQNGNRSIAGLMCRLSVLGRRTIWSFCMQSNTFYWMAFHWHGTGHHHSWRARLIHSAGCMQSLISFNVHSWIFAQIITGVGLDTLKMVILMLLIFKVYDICVLLFLGIQSVWMSSPLISTLALWNSIVLIELRSADRLESLCIKRFKDLAMICLLFTVFATISGSLWKR